MPSLAKIVLLCVLITASDKRTPTVNLPKDIYHAKEIELAKAGAFIPKTVITDPYMTNLIAVIPYGDELEQMKYVNEAKRGITKALRALRAAEKVRCSIFPRGII